MAIVNCCMVLWIYLVKPKLDFAFDFGGKTDDVVVFVSF